MARIDGEVTAGAIMQAAMQELDSPTGLMQGPGEMDMSNPQQCSDMCSAMVQAHPGA